VKSEYFLVSAIRAIGMANVASARYTPRSRRAGNPNRNPTTPVIKPASGIVARSFQPWSTLRIVVT
jgi:hypothetical protein